MAVRRQQKINKKLEIQKTQIRTMLTELRKSKYKCLAITEQLQTQLPNKAQYQALQKQIQRKKDLLDLEGLLNLKTKLRKSIQQLNELQVDLILKKERAAVRNQIAKEAHPPQHPNQNIRNQPNNSSLNDNKTVEKQSKVQKKNPQQFFKKKLFEISEQKQSAFKVPFYRKQEDSSQNKIQRISKYIASLKSTQQKELGNMKLHAQDRAQEKILEILTQIPQFVNMKNQLQKIKKQKNEIEAKLKQSSRTAVQDYINSAELIQQGQNYLIVKIPKKQGLKYEKLVKKSNQKPQYIEGDKYHNEQSRKKSEKQNIKILGQITEPLVPRRLKVIQLQQQLQAIKSRKKDADILEIQNQLQKQQYDVGSVVSRINQTLQTNEQQLRILREKRIKIFQKQQEIWSQLDQI